MIWLRHIAVIAALAFSAPAFAQEKPESHAVASDDDPTEGTGLLSVAGDVAVLDPSHGDRERDIGVGFTVQALGKRTRWPVMVGLGFGILAFGEKTYDGPSARYVDDTDSVVTSGSRWSEDIQIRHLELLLRVEPWWGWVRPFIDGGLGFAALWHTETLSSSLGEELLSNEEKLDFAALFLMGAGLDVRLYSSKGRHVTTDIVLTLSMRRLYTSPMRRPVWEDGESGPGHSSSVRAWLGLWQPSLGVGISLDSRAETNPR